MNPSLRLCCILWLGVLVICPARVILAADVRDFAGDWFSDDRQIFVQIAPDTSVTLRALDQPSSPEQKAALKGSDRENFVWEAAAFTLRARLDEKTARFVRIDKSSGAIESFACRRLDPERDRAIYDRIAGKSSPPKTDPAQPSTTEEPAVAAAGAVAPPVEAFEMANVDRAPQPIYQIAPKYPSELLRKGVGGEVLVDFLVTHNGDVANAWATQSTNREFDNAAIQAVSQWKFRPGQKGGKPVVTHMVVPIVFDAKAAAKVKR